MSIGICVVIAYSIMLFAEDVVQKIPSYADDDYDGISKGLELKLRETKAFPGIMGPRGEQSLTVIENTRKT